MSISREAIEALRERLAKRILAEHGGTGDRYKDHWSLTRGDSELHRDALAALAPVSYAGTVHDGRLTVYADGVEVWSCGWPAVGKFTAIDSLTSWLLHRFGSDSPEAREALTCIEGVKRESERQVVAGEPPPEIERQGEGYVLRGETAKRFEEAMVSRESKVSMTPKQAVENVLPLLEGLTRRKYPESTGLEAQIDAILPDPMTLRQALAFAKGWIKATDSDGDTDRVIAKIDAALAGAPTAEQADELVLSLVSAHAGYLGAFNRAFAAGIRQPALGNLPELAKYEAAYEKVLTALGVRAQSPAEPLIERQQRRLHEAMDALEWLNESGYRLAEDDRETLSGLIAQQEKQ